MLRVYGLICFTLTNAVFCYLYTDSVGSSLVLISFFLNLLCIAIGLNQSVRNKQLNLDTIIWVFVYMFFFLAPIVQINYAEYFPNSLPITKSDILRANSLLFLWNIIYLLFRRQSQVIKVSESTDNKAVLSFVNNYVRTGYFLAALSIATVTFARFKLGFFFGDADYSTLISNKSILLLVNISVQGAVFANWLFSFNTWKRKGNIANFIYVLVSSIIAIYQLSPFNTNRSYIGFCIIVIVYLYYSQKINPSRFLWIIFSGLLFIFPIMNNFRYGFQNFEMPSLYHLMFDQLTELHFDAYSNLIATFHYVNANGFAYGYQMLGVLFFFVPRNIWSGKPLSSGEAVGNFISTRFEMNFTNISNPIPSEFYINFGWFGIFLGAYLISKFVNRLESDAITDRYTHALIAGYLFVIYRGDLMNAFAYCFGTYVIMVIVPKAIFRLSKQSIPLQPVRRLHNG
ncbi:oligosaccharide repeat unit polymerase [Cohnella herbarum]|uniref:Oligosaccharide repeat unit polymerase n=1 Tax=Cohnella herbarum TaxID=2728023 RepID=A0A7Z2VPQ5_9BACL|nr:oligosaccharide repeat unit polymerase [Cohnella herbarum]